MEGKKVVGRPRTKLLDWMIRETGGGNYENLKKLRWTEQNGGHGVLDLSEDRKLNKEGCNNKSLECHVMASTQ